MTSFTHGTHAFWNVLHQLETTLEISKLHGQPFRQPLVETCLRLDWRSQDKDKLSHIASAGGKGQSSNVTQPSLGEDVAWSSKQSVKMDRSQWLDDPLKTGDWNEIRRLREGHRPQR